MRTTTSSRPSTPPQTTVEQQDEDDIQTGSWTDDPLGISSTYRWEWISLRHFNRTTKKWSRTFTRPELYEHYGEDGEDGEDAITVSADGPVVWHYTDDDWEPSGSQTSRAYWYKDGVEVANASVRFNEPNASDDINASNIVNPRGGSNPRKVTGGLQPYEIFRYMDVDAKLQALGIKDGAAAHSGIIASPGFYMFYTQAAATFTVDITWFTAGEATSGGSTSSANYVTHEVTCRVTDLQSAPAWSHRRRFGNPGWSPSTASFSQGNRFYGFQLTVQRVTVTVVLFED